MTWLACRLGIGQTVRHEAARMDLLERAAKHNEAVDRGEAEPFA